MFQGKLYEYDGQMVSIKVIAGKVHLAPSTIYRYLNKGLTLDQAIHEGIIQSSKLFQNRTKTNNMIAQKYPWKGGEYTVAEIADMEGISREPIYRRLKDGVSLTEAVSSIKSHVSDKYPFMHKMVSLYRISLITGVPKSYLMKYLTKDREYKEEEVMSIVDSYQKPPILMVGSESLVRYCINHQINYNVIYYLIKSRSMTVENAISYYQVHGQGKGLRYQFVLGEVLLYHFLILEKIDSRYTSDRMNKGDSEIEAIQAAVFLSKEDYKTRNERMKLYRLYQQYGIDAILQIPLEEEDQNFIREKHERIEKVLYDYRIFEVMELLPTAQSEEERKYLLDSVGLTLEDILEKNEQLLTQFEEIHSRKENEQIRYIWKGYQA